MTILHGDALTMLRTLPDASVHCCVTSPPYWGLRDYGTAEWEGGDVECDHRQVTLRIRRNLAEAANASDGGNRKAENRHDKDALGLPYRDICGKCGARRVDEQLGLEATPDCGMHGKMRLRKDLSPDQLEYVIRRLQDAGLLGAQTYDNDNTK